MNTKTLKPPFRRRHAHRDRTRCGRTCCSPTTSLLRKERPMASIEASHLQLSYAFRKTMQAQFIFAGGKNSRKAPLADRRRTTSCGAKRPPCDRRSPPDRAALGARFRASLRVTSHATTTRIPRRRWARLYAPRDNVARAARRSAAASAAHGPKEAASHREHRARLRGRRGKRSSRCRALIYASWGCTIICGSCEASPRALSARNDALNRRPVTTRASSRERRSATWRRARARLFAFQCKHTMSSRKTGPADNVGPALGVVVCASRGEPSAAHVARRFADRCATSARRAHERRQDRGNSFEVFWRILPPRRFQRVPDGQFSPRRPFSPAMPARLPRMNKRGSGRADGAEAAPYAPVERARRDGWKQGRGTVPALG